MTDPRNVAHDKKVQQEKKKHGEEIAPGSEHVPQPGQKPRILPSDKDDKSKDEFATVPSTDNPEAVPKQ